MTATSIVGYIAGVSMVFSIGYFLGSLVSTSRWLSYNWKVLRWDDNILGYRVSPCPADAVERSSMLMLVELDGETAELLVRKD